MTKYKSGLFVLITLVALCVSLATKSASAQITLKLEDYSACTSACDAEKLAEEHQACITKDVVNKCMEEREECNGWPAEFRTGMLDYCEAFGEHMCGCGEKALRPATGSAAKSVKRPKPPSKEGAWKPEGKPRIEELSEEEGCVASNGVWVKIVEERCEIQGDKHVCQDYAMNRCWKIGDAYDDFQKIKKLIEELRSMPAMQLTEEDVDLIKRLKGFDFTKGFAKEHDWESERQKILGALEAICSVSSDEEIRINTELKAGEDLLVAKCQAVRAKIKANEARSKKALKTADEAEGVANEAKDLAETAVKQTRPSYLRISAVGGVHFVRTHQYNGTGDEVVGYGGVEAQWWHPITPAVALSLEGGLGYSNRFYDSNSVTSWLGVGLGTELGKDVLGSLHLQASHFFASDEWSKLNTYSIAPELTWAPGLSEKKPGDVVPALTLRLSGGMMRTNLEGPGIVQDPFAGGVLGLGVLF